MRTLIKVCGLVRESDAEQAARLGADLLGFVFAESPRRVDPGALERWLPALRVRYPGARMVGVFTRPTGPELQAVLERVPLDFVQLHGTAGAHESEVEAMLRAQGRLVLAFSTPELTRRLAAKEMTVPWAYLVDSAGPEGGGGTGRTHDWSLLPPAPRPYRLILAGGLAADNVPDAVRRVKPFAVDAASRLERAPGEKDVTKIEAFIAAVRAADREGENEGDS